jgi:hypothetical protein
MNLAYAAGFVDGEGCIGFTRCRNSVYPRVLVTNTNIEILEEFKEKWGGDIKPLSLRKENWKQGYSWRISWSKAVDFLSQIEPYLKIKWPQAHTVFAWNEIRPGRGQKWDEECLEFLVDRISWLNKKGPKTDCDPLDIVLKEIQDEARSLCQCSRQAQAYR